jgi:hypothetical protein
MARYQGAATGRLPYTCIIQVSTVKRYGPGLSRFTSRSCGFCGYVERLCAMQSGNRGLREVLTITFPALRRFEAARRKVYTGITKLIARAQAAGALRAEFVPEDLLMLVMANAGVVAGAGQNAPQASPRLIGYLLQAFAAPGSGKLPPPPSSRQMYRALLRLEDASELGTPNPARAPAKLESLHRWLAEWARVQDKYKALQLLWTVIDFPQGPLRPLMAGYIVDYVSSLPPGSAQLSTATSTPPARRRSSCPSCSASTTTGRGASTGS